jgi:hypothetical protein
VKKWDMLKVKHTHTHTHTYTHTSLRDRTCIRTRPRNGQMLDLWSPEFKMAVINMLRSLMNTVDNMKEQMDNINRNSKKGPKKKC